MTEQRQWFPRKTLVLTLLIVIAIAVLKIFQLELAEWTQLGPDFLNVIAILALALLLPVWVLWILFCSPFGLTGRIGMALGVAAVPVLFFVFFQPQFGGSMELRGLHYRFGPAQDAQVFVRGNATADLLDENLPYAYPGFLGPGRDATLPGPRIDSDWVSNPPELLWKRVVGAGWSGVAIANGYLVTLEQRGQDEMVTCYRLDDGNPVWEQGQIQRHEDPMALGRQGPRSTPTISGGRVFAQGATGRLWALQGDTGEVIWEVDLCELLGIGQNIQTNGAGYRYSYEKSRLAWGRAASPLIVDDLVVIPGGYGDDQPELGATLLAFDAATGQLRWKSGEEMIAYGSPSLATLAGTRQILLQAENQAMGFDAGSGQVLWKYARKGTSNADANCSQVTLVDEDHVLLTKGYGLGGELIRISRDGEDFTVTPVWSSARVLRTKLTNPVVRDGHAWSLSDGFIECTDLKDGRQVWKQRTRYGDGQLLLVGEWLVIHAETGMLQLVQATAREPEASVQIPTISGVCWNTLAISNDLLVVRSDQEMACFRLKTAAGGDSSVAATGAETSERQTAE